MEEELWLAGMSKVHAKIWADKYDELGRIADSRKVLIEGLEAENQRYRRALQWISDNSFSHPANMVMVAREGLGKL